MTKEEAKNLAYVEKQRDQARKELADRNAQISELAAKTSALQLVADKQIAELQALANTEHAAAEQLGNDCVRLANDVESLERARLILREDLAVAQTAISVQQKVITDAEAKLAALQADEEGKDKLKKRLAAKAEELRLCQNELGALKAARAVPKSLDAMIAECIRLHGPDAVVGHVLSSKVRV